LRTRRELRDEARLRARARPRAGGGTSLLDGTGEGNTILSSDRWSEGRPMMN